jgi:hypothetical protein
MPPVTPPSPRADEREPAPRKPVHHCTACGTMYTGSYHVCH